MKPQEEIIVCAACFCEIESVGCGDEFWFKCPECGDFEGPTITLTEEEYNHFYQGK